MKITLDEWLEMEQLAKQAGRALTELRSLVTNNMLAHHQAGNERETALLRDIEARVNEAQSVLAPSLFHVQSEWTGGPSDDPKNFTLREPNLVTISHSFPREQVEKYRQPGTGEIKIPGR